METIRSREAGIDSSGRDFLATQEGPLAVVLFLEVLYLFQPPNLSWFSSQKKEVFSTKDLALCHGQAQIVLLPKHFSLPMALRSNSRGHHKDLPCVFLTVTALRIN